MWLVFGAVASLASCRGPAPSRIRIAHESDVISLDPGAVAEATTDSILSNIYEGLVAFDKDMRLVPSLAVNWTTPDERTWLIQLRKDVRFHDGGPLTSADVKHTLDRARTNPDSPVKGYVSTISEVSISGESTLRLRTLRPDPLLLNRLTYVLIVPRSGAQDHAAHPVGTGPYRFVRWERNRVLEVESFPDHWGGKPAIDRVEFVPVEEGARSIQVLRQRQVDVLRYVPETMVDDLRAVREVRVAARLGLSSYYLWFDCQQRPGGPRNPFADRRVREAISLVIDRKEIIRRLGGSGVPADQLVQQGIFGYISSLPGLPFDPERSRRLLVEAGYGDGFDATLVHKPQSSVAAVGEAVRAMLAPVRIRLRLEAPEWPRMVAAWEAGQLPFFLARWRFDDGDATSFLKDCLYTRDPARSTGVYNPGFSSPALDRLIEENDQIFGEARRLKHYAKLMRIAVDEMPLVPLYHRMNFYGVSRRVKWEPRLDEKLLAAEMSLQF